MRHLRIALAALGLAACSAGLPDGTLPCTKDDECPQGGYCGQDGKCFSGPTCPAAQTLCHDKCVDTTTDVANCDTCGNACPAHDNATPTCTSSACGFTCVPAAKLDGTRCRLPPAAPHVPTLTVTQGNVVLDWNVTDGADSYEVQRLNNIGIFVPVGTTTDTHFNDGNLTNGTRYTYVVAAVNLAGKTLSPMASALTPLPAPVNVGVAIKSTSEVLVFWDAVANADSYTVLRSLRGSTPSPQAIGLGANQFDQSGLSPGTRYTYTVVATNSVTSSDASPGVDGITLLDAPSGFSTGNATNFTLTLTWGTSVGAANYAVSRSEDGGLSYPTPVIVGQGTVFTDTQLAPGKTYFYRLFATTADTMSPAASAQGTTVLNAPGSLNENAAGTSSITLVWGSVTGATGYEVRRKEGDQFAHVASPVAISYVDTGLTQGSLFSYQVFATTADAISLPVELDNANTAMPAVTGLNPSQTTDTQITLTWGQVQNTDHYLVQRSVSGGNFTVIGNAGANLFFQDNTIAAGTAYQYQVQAVSPDGVAGPFSASAPITSALPTPTGFSVDLTSITSTALRLNWQATPGANKYFLYRSPDHGANYFLINTVTATTYFDTGVSEGLDTYYQLVAGSQDATSLPATTHAVTLLDQVGNVSAAPSGTSITLTWSQVPGASYHVLRNNGGTFQILGNASATTYTDQGLVHGTSYTYEVVAVTPDQTGPVSAPITSTTTIDQVTGVITTPSPGTMTVSWNQLGSPPSYTYEIDRSDDNGASFFAVQPGFNGGSYGDTSASPGSAYLYKVRALTADGSGPFSLAVNAVMPLAQPAGLVIKEISADHVTLQWVASTNATQYALQRSSASGGVNLGTTTGTAFVDRGPFVGNTSYVWVVIAQKPSVAGTDSPPASIGGVVPMFAPGPIQAAAVDSNHILLSWPQVSGAVSFNILRSSDGGATYNSVGSISSDPNQNPNCTAGIPCFKDQSLTGMTQYLYEVQSAAPGVAPLPTSEAVAAATPPLPPTGLTAGSVTSTQVVINWTPPAGETPNYQVQTSQDNVNWNIASTSQGVASYTDLNVQPGHTYYYRVESFTNIYGASTFAGPLSVTTPSTILNAPGSFTASASGAGINLTWTTSSGATNYNIERSDDGGLTWFLEGNTNALTFLDTEVNFGGLEQYRICATSSSGSSAFAGPLTTGAPSYPPPTGATATANGAYVNLNCGAYSGPSPTPDVYIWARSADLGKTWAVVGTGSSCALTDNTPPLGQALIYAVSVQLSSNGNQSFNSAPARLLPATVAAPNTNPAFPDDMTVSWTAVPGATGYLVQRAPKSTNVFAPVGQVASLFTTTATTYEDRDVTPGTLYFWRVDAYSPFGTVTGASSAQKNTNATSLSPPGGVAANPSQSSVVLNWSAGGGSAFNGYNLYRSTDGNNYTQLGNTFNNLTYTDSSGISPGTTYYYKLDSNSSTGSHSIAVNVSTTTTPGTPVLSGAGGASAVTLSWTASPGATSYYILRSNTSGGPYNQIAGSGSNSYTDGSGTAGTTWFYTVKAVLNATQVSPASNEIAATPGSGVGGSRLVTYVSPDSAANNYTTVPDLSNFSVQAVLADGSTHSGVFANDGTFAIDSVPAGTFWLVAHNGSTTTWHQVTARSFDMGFDTLGRGPPTNPTISPTYLNFAATGMTAFGSLDWIEYFAPHISVANFGMLPLQPLLPGATSFSNMLVDFAVPTFVEPMVQNDNLYIAQEGTKLSTTGATYTALTAFASPLVTMNDGVLNDLGSVTLAAPGTQQTLTNFIYKRSQWKGQALSVNPAATILDDRWIIGPLPQGDTKGFTANPFGNPDLAGWFNPADTGTQDINYGTISYGNPYPWPVFGFVQVNFSVRYNLPGNSGSISLGAGFAYQEPMATFAADVAALHPKVLAVQSVRLAGLSAFQDSAGVGLTPTLSWSAPSTGADWYRVSLQRLNPTSGSKIISINAGVFVLPGSQLSLTVPSGVLAQGSWYNARISSFIEPAHNTAAPNRLTASVHSAQVLTAKFTP